MNPTAEQRTGAGQRAGVEELGGVIHAFSSVLAELRAAQAALAERAGEVHRLDKLAALATMAGGIAHEIRNPLNAVRGFAALLAERVSGDSKEALWSRRILEGVDECNAIVSSMLSLAEPEALALETLNSREWVEGALELCRAEIEDPARYAIELDVEDLKFPGDRIKLRQALRNLLANAIQAQPEGGRVALSLAADGDELCLRLTDDGPGFPQEAAERATDPFFTTRADGSGLGLALVQAITRLHGGTFSIQPPTAGCGAEVRLRLPLSIPTNRR